MKNYNIYNKGERTWDYVFSVNELQFKDEKTGANTHKGKRYELKYSNGSHWSSNLRDTVVFSAVDDGDNLIIEQSIPNTMDFSTFADFHIFMSMIKNVDSNLMSNYEITETLFEI